MTSTASPEPTNPARTTRIIPVRQLVQSASPAFEDDAEIVFREVRDALREGNAALSFKGIQMVYPAFAEHLVGGLEDLMTEEQLDTSYSFVGASQQVKMQMQQMHAAMHLPYPQEPDGTA